MTLRLRERWGSRRGLAAAMLAAGLSLVSACGGSGGGGTTITVALAVQKPPADALAGFTKQTGITVNWVQVGWDDLQTKIAAAASAHTYFADVTDVDWSKIGQYHRLKWFRGLKSDIDVSSWRQDMPSFDSFVASGDVVGVPMDSSFMVSTVNRKMLEAAGITTMPTTIDEYTNDLKTVQSKGVNPHPLGIPFSAAEGLSTYWYETTAAFGGHVLTPDGRADFTSPSSAGYRAMEWMASAYRSGLVPSENLNKTDTDEMNNEMPQGQLASIFSDYSGNVETVYDMPGQSKVIGQTGYLPTPSASGGPGMNLTNPDGLGIPVTARSVQNALTFIKWFDERGQQARWAGAQGSKAALTGFTMPARTSALQDVVASGKVPAAQTELDMLQHRVQPVFPGGAPPWYADFSKAVYTNLHEVAAGHGSVDSAIKAIAAKVDDLRSSG